MNKPWTVLETLAATDSKLEKQAIIEAEAKAGNDNFFRGCKLASDPMVTFGVKKVEEKPAKRPSEPEPKGLDPEKFFELCDKLATRKLTGDAAQVAIGYARNQATEDEWNGWYRLVLIKDLKGGFGESTINKVCEKKYPQYAIPVFEVQLAKDCAGDDTLLVGTKLIDCKLDGCLSEDWIVEFDDGQKIAIKEVVDSRIKGKVKSFNTITGKIEFNEITGWAVDGADDAVAEYEWFVITLENGKKTPPLTGNHLVYLPLLKCYRRVDLLTENDVLLADI